MITKILLSNKYNSFIHANKRLSTNRYKLEWITVIYISKYRKNHLSVVLTSRTCETTMLSDVRDMTRFPFCFEDLGKELSHISPLIG